VNRALIFEGASQLDDHDNQLVRELIEAVLLRHDARRWTEAS
jgi:hypothetical protein